MNRALRLASISFAVCVSMLVLGSIAEASGRVYPSAEAVEPLGPGARVPAATVFTVAGEAFELPNVFGESGALLVFYRGGW